MSLTRTLIEQGKVAAEERRRAAAEKLRELLARDAHPDEGDAEALVATCDVLRISPNELPPTLELVQSLQKCEQLAPDVETLQTERERKNAALGEALVWADKARVELEEQIRIRLAPLNQAQAAIESRYNDAKDARGTLALLQDRWTAFVEQRDVEEVRRARRAQENT